MSSAKPRRITQTPLFGRKIKKFRPPEKAALDQEVQKIFSNPETGQEKKGDLRGIRVHKYRIQKQEMLLAYAFNEQEIMLINIGGHENYYQELKNYLA